MSEEVVGRVKKVITNHLGISEDKVTENWWKGKRNG